MGEERNVPRLRFPEFTEDWEQRKLGDVFVEYSEKRHEELPPLTIIQGGGTILREESDRALQYDKSSLSGYKRVKKDDFIVHLRSFEGGLEKATTDGIISPAYHTFHGENTDSRFYYPFFRSRRFIDVLLKPHVYGIRDGKSIDIDGMKTIIIPVPSYEEQKAIGGYIETLDKLITLHQRKYKALKEYKHGMLQKMFPIEGQKVPEVRFPGFTKAWEQRKLGDIGTLKRGKRFTPADYVESNGIPCIHYGQIYTKYGAVATKTISQLRTNLRDQLQYANPGDIILAGTSEDPTTVCKAVAWMGSSQVAYHDDSFSFSSNEDSLFLTSFFQSKAFHMQKASVVYGVTVKRVNSDALSNAVIMLPSIDEQQKVGALFLTIDNLVSFYQRRFEELKNYKNGLLQQMFI